MEDQTGAPEQIAAMQKVKSERGKPVYALPLMNGALLVENGKISLLGNAKLMQNEEAVI